MKKLCALFILSVMLLTLFAGCRFSPSAPTEPSDPAVTELAVTMENIKAYIKENVTYAEVRAAFGYSDKDLSGDPVNYSQRIWYLDEDSYKGAYVQIDFRYPGDPYYRFDEWCKALNLPAELTPGSADYHHYLGVWLESLQATNALIRKDGQTVEVLFGEDYYTPSPTEPTENFCPRTIEYFKSHLKPYMTYSEMKNLFGSCDTNMGSSDHIATRVWYLEDDYFVAVTCFPTANEYMHEYLATQPTGEDGTPHDELYYFLEWKNHMQAYNATLYKNTFSEKNKIEVWFDCGGNPWRQ